MISSSLSSFFVSGYLSVMSAEKESVQLYMMQHLQDIMADAELYGWEPIWVFHAVWLQQLEQGHVTWADEAWSIDESPCGTMSQHQVKQAGTRRIIHRKSNRKPPRVSMCQPGQVQGLAWVTTMACTCSNPTPHPKDLCACCYCITNVRRICPYLEHFCWRKGEDLAWNEEVGV